MKICPICDKPLTAYWSPELDTHWKCDHCKLITIIIGERK